MTKEECIKAARDEFNSQNVKREYIEQIGDHKIRFKFKTTNGHRAEIEADFKDALRANGPMIWWSEVWISEERWGSCGAFSLRQAIIGETAVDKKTHEFIEPK